MVKKKTPTPKRKGPKLMGTHKRIRRTLCFDPTFFDRATKRAQREGKSLSLWLEDLGKEALRK